MRRYRFGRIAALLATTYVAAVVAFCVIALVTGDPGLLRQLVTGEWEPSFLPHVWWLELVVAAAGVLQGWAYWQVLRGRLRGELTSRGRAVGLLRATLYVSVAYSLLLRLPIPYGWWQSTLGPLIQLAVVWLYFVVLAGVIPRWLRLVAVVAGTFCVVVGLADSIAFWMELASLKRLLGSFPLYGLISLMWVAPVLAAQARDARWSRTTVWTGTISAALSFLSPSSEIFITSGGVDFTYLFSTLMGVLSVFGLVWEARSAHELAHPRPALPPVRVAPARAVARPWPLAAVAVVLPLIPAAVNLAGGMPVWIGPRGMVDTFFNEYAALLARLAWVSLDLLVGVGAIAVLVLVAVVRRTRRLLLVAQWSLALAAAAGAVSVLTTERDPDWADFPDFPDFLEQRLRFYPKGLFGPNGNGQLSFGLSPLWYSAALAGSALLLFFLYAAAPARRRPVHVLAAAAAMSVALCFLPVADQTRGPVTTAAECSPQDTWGPEREEPRPRTGTHAFVCAVRESRTIGFADTTPDQVLLAYGRRLCGVYTRNDPQETARLRASEKLDVRELDGVLSGICPSADASVKAERAAEDREFAGWQAEEQAKCDSIPPHRPLVEPARSIVVKDPQWPEAGLEIYEETEDGGDPYEDAVFDKALDNGLVAGAPGHLAVVTDSDNHVCVTLETYARRPPVETKGWDHVVEVGYDSPTGRMELMDGLGGTVLPDLSLNGRKGHYRVRVHFAWVPWKGDEYGTQRLLIMAYPGNGDKVITYRKPAGQR